MTEYNFLEKPKQQTHLHQLRRGDANDGTRACPTAVNGSVFFHPFTMDDPQEFYRNSIELKSALSIMLIIRL